MNSLRISNLLKTKQSILNNNFKILSKDPNTQVSASLFDQDSNLISIGYNGTPRGSNLDQYSSFFPRDIHHVYSNLFQRLKDFHSKDNKVLQNLLKEDNFFSFCKEIEQTLFNIFCENHFDHIYKYYVFEHAERNLLSNFLRSELNANKLIAIVKQIHNPEDVRALITSGVNKILIVEDFILSKEEFNTFKIYFEKFLFNLDKNLDLENKETNEVLSKLTLGLNCLALLNYQTTVLYAPELNPEEQTEKTKLLKFSESFEHSLVEYQNKIDSLLKHTEKRIKELKEEQLLSDEKVNEILDNTTEDNFSAVLSSINFTNEKITEDLISLLIFRKIYEKHTPSNYCGLLKEDYSILNLSFDEINNSLLVDIENQLNNNPHCFELRGTEEVSFNTYDIDFGAFNIEESLDFLRLSAIKNCIYTLTSRFLKGKNYSLNVTLEPCIYCFSALISCGVKKIYLNHQSSVSKTSNFEKWKKEWDKISHLIYFLNINVFRH